MERSTTQLPAARRGAAAPACAAAAAPRPTGRHRPAASPRRAGAWALACASAFAALPAAAQDRTFNQPRHHDERLDWCLNWGTDCGRPAAVAFCQRRRYEDVAVFRAERVGRSAPTRLIGTDQVCRGSDHCTAFAYITCTRPIPADRVFVNPAWKGHRLDVCVRWGADCGQPAADAYCRSRRFAAALQWTADRDPGYASTRLIGTDQVCDQPFCRGFQQIVCR